MKVLVATAAHRGDDARIAFRQIRALINHGHQVVYVAPEPAVLGEEVERVVVPRTSGLRRVGSWMAVAREVRRYRDRVDLVLAHDLEIVLPIRLMRPGVPVVWDVHEDLPASVGDRQWIPSPLRGVAVRITSLLERLACRGTLLLLAEESYRERLGDWPVVPNSSPVPPLAKRIAEAMVVYVGRLSRGRGAETMVAIGEALRDEARVVLIGAADGEVLESIRRADADGSIDWRGPMPNPDALAVVEKATVGLSLLNPLPNYVGSMPTKIYEYFARGVPVVTTPLPLAEEAVSQSGAGRVVPFDDPSAAVEAIRAYLREPDDAREEGARGHDWVAKYHNWDRDADAFVATLDSWASIRRRKPDQ